MAARSILLSKMGLSATRASLPTCSCAGEGETSYVADHYTTNHLRNEHEHEHENQHEKEDENEHVHGHSGGKDQLDTSRIKNKPSRQTHVLRI